MSPDEAHGDDADSLVAVPLIPRLARWAIVAGLGALILYGSLTPESLLRENGAEGAPAGLNHAVLYAALAFSLAYAWARWEARPWLKALAVVALVVGYGGLMEALQTFRPTRRPELVDVLANLLGAVLGALWCFVEPRIRYHEVARSA